MSPGRKFFLLFDFAYNNVRGIEKAQKAALHFIDTIAGPRDQVAVLSYAAIGGLAFHEYLTTDHAQVRKVLQAIGHKDVKGRATEIEDYYWRLVQSYGGPFVLNLRAEAEANRAESEDMAQKYMLTLTDLARALRLVDGEKNFILFSSGIPNSLIYGYATSNVFNRSDVGQASGNNVLRRQNETMYKEFGAAGCAFYAFDTRESSKEASLFTYDEETFAMGSRTLTTAVEPYNVFKDDKATGLNTLKRFTDQTGGKFYSNINMYERNLAQVQQATGAYYVLGYAVNEKWDGQFHEVKVEVKRKGCEVRTQAGYFNPKPYAEYSDLEKQIHLFDLAINERSFSRMPGSVPMTALTYAAEGVSKLAVLAGVPREMTAKFTGPKLELVALFFDDDGDIREIVREEVDTAALRGRDMVLAAGSTLRPGEYAGRLVIRDMTTGQSAVASARATVGKPAAAGLQLGTPLLLAEGTGVPLREAAGKKAAEPPPFGEGYPYDTSRFAPILGDAPPAVSAALRRHPLRRAGRRRGRPGPVRASRRCGLGRPGPRRRDPLRPRPEGSAGGPDARARPRRDPARRLLSACLCQGPEVGRPRPHLHDLGHPRPLDLVWGHVRFVRVPRLHSRRGTRTRGTCPLWLPSHRNPENQVPSFC